MIGVELYPTRKEMAEDIMDELKIKDDERMYDKEFGYCWLIDLKKGCLSTLWEKICNVK